MNGIKMSDCKFYVDESARTVICVIPSKLPSGRLTKNMLIDFIGDHCNFSDLEISYGINYHWADKALQMPRSFIGKAVCAEEDEWDEELGKMIAFQRAKNKCYRSFFKRANVLAQTLDRRLGDMIDLFNDLGLKLEKKREALDVKINERVGNGTSK